MNGCAKCSMVCPDPIGCTLAEQARRLAELTARIEALMRSIREDRHVLVYDDLNAVLRGA